MRNCRNQAIADMLLLYAVTDRGWVESSSYQNLYEQVEDAIKGGVTCVQLREKSLSEPLFLEEAMAIRKLCYHYNVPFIVNDNMDIAVKCAADGIHIGQSDIKPEKVREAVGWKMIVGVSVHTIEQAVSAQNAGADYLGVGAVFSTNTKTDAEIVPHKTLKEICDKTDIPVVAIGGINKENIMELSGLGVDGVALVSAIFAADNIENECRILRELSVRSTSSHSQQGLFREKF